MDEQLIAPCGMNYRLCIAFQAGISGLNQKGFRKTTCPGCLPRGKNCLHMGDRCAQMAAGQIRYCFQCASFPCKQLKALDRRYRTKYHMSMIDNLTWIRDRGMSSFLKREVGIWRCSRCGGVICCHNGLCLNCDLELLRKNRRYRWNETDSGEMRG